MDPLGIIGPVWKPNGFTGRYMTVKSYIQLAYGIRNWDWIVGLAWLNDDSPTYSIDAKAPGTVSEKELRAMLRNLLAERSD